MAQNFIVKFVLYVLNSPKIISNFLCFLHGSRIKLFSNPKMKWIPYSQIENLIEIAKGGFGIIYKATLSNETVALKKFINSQNMSKYFLNEVIIFYILYFVRIFCLEFTETMHLHFS